MLCFFLPFFRENLGEGHVFLRHLSYSSIFSYACATTVLCRGLESRGDTTRGSPPCQERASSPVSQPKTCAEADPNEKKKMMILTTSRLLLFPAVSFSLPARKRALLLSAPLLLSHMRLSGVVLLVPCWYCRWSSAGRQRGVPWVGALTFFSPFLMFTTCVGRPILSFVEDTPAEKKSGSFEDD